MGVFFKTTLFFLFILLLQFTSLITQNTHTFLDLEVQEKDYSPYYQKTFFQGKIIKVDKENNSILIYSNQNSILKKEISKILYLHKDKEAIQTPFIFKIRHIDYLRGIIQASLLSGTIKDVNVNEIVNNILHWNTYEYKVQANYTYKEKKISVQRTLIIPNRIIIQSAFGQKSEIINMQDVKKINLTFNKDTSTFKITSFTLNDNKKINPYFSHFNLSKSFPINDLITISNGESKSILMSNKNLVSIDILEKIKGVFKTLTFHHWRLNSLTASRTKKKDISNVKIRFMSYELILFSIEKWLSDAKSEKEESYILPYLKDYSLDKIYRIYLTGSFSNWKLLSSNSILTKSSIYPYHSTQFDLPVGLHEYYFIVHLNYKKNLNDLYVKILDPYSKVGIKYLGLSCNNDLIKNEFELLKKPSFLSLFKIKSIFDPVLWILKENLKKNTISSLNEDDEDSKNSLNEYNLNQLIYTLYPYEDMTSKRLVQFKNTIKISPIKKMEKPTLSKNNYKTNISIEKEPYYKVTFEFNQVYSIRKQILQKINYYEKNNSKKKYYEYVLEKFDENKIGSIYLFLKNINTNQSFRLPMIKDTKDLWILEIYLEKGLYEYQYQIDLNINGIETYIFHNETPDNVFLTLDLRK